MKSISIRKRFIKVLNYQDFNEKVKRNGYRELQKFTCLKAPELQKFIRNEVTSSTPIYIIYDTNAKIIVGYYTFAASCMWLDYEEEEKNITVSHELKVETTMPCLEIEKFAINEKYLEWLDKKGYNNKKIGKFVFREYMCKCIVSLSGLMKISCVILHALDIKKVIESYVDMGFDTFGDDMEVFYSADKELKTVKSSYVNDCVFMYQPYDRVLDKFLEGGM